jgi:hypothetical protein
VWLVTGNPRIDHVHVCSGTTSVIRNGSQIPTGVRTRPARPAYNGASGGSTAETLGPHRVHVPAEVRRSHAAAGGAATVRLTPMVIVDPWTQVVGEWLPVLVSRRFGVGCARTDGPGHPRDHRPEHGEPRRR